MFCFNTNDVDWNVSQLPATVTAQVCNNSVSQHVGHFLPMTTDLRCFQGLVFAKNTWKVCVLDVS